MHATAKARIARDNAFINGEILTENHEPSGWEIHVPAGSGVNTAVAPQCHTYRPVQISAGSPVMFGDNEIPHDAANGMCFMTRHRYSGADRENLDMQYLSNNADQDVVARLQCYGRFRCEPPEKEGHPSKLFVEASDGYRPAHRPHGTGTFIRHKGDSCFIVDGKPMKRSERREVKDGSVVLCLSLIHI